MLPPMNSPPPLAPIEEFSVTDAEPAQWDGSVEVTGARVASLTGARFYKDDQVRPDGKSWKCATRRRPMTSPPGGGKVTVDIGPDDKITLTFAEEAASVA